MVNEQFVLSDKDRTDFDAFKRTVFKRTGIDLNLYKPQQMHRRLQALVERANLRSFTEYARVIESSPDEMATFLDRMTINVSELFRNPEKWVEVREKILPALLRKAASEGRPLKVWSAGCSFGAEPYTLAMILDEIAGGTRVTLLATDIDDKILARARQGVFQEMDLKNVEPAARKKYLRPEGAGFQVQPELRSRITFRKHNLLADAFEREFDLIVCRNVVIYFTDDAKDRLYRRFTDSLRPGGIIFVGGTERIFNYREIGLDTRIPFFYEKAVA